MTVKVELTEESPVANTPLAGARQGDHGNVPFWVVE